MAVQALKDYHFPPADSQEKFNGGQLLYVGWDKHLMFCSPLAFCLPPSMCFADLCEQTLRGAYAYHPEASQIDFTKATWLKSGQPFVPDMGRTLAENGLGHKDVLRLQTPGLNGIAGSCS